MLEYSDSDIDQVYAFERREADEALHDEVNYLKNPRFDTRNQVWCDYGGLPGHEDPPFPYSGIPVEWHFSYFLSESDGSFKTFHEMIQSRREIGKPSRVLDLMGPGLFACDSYPSQRWGDLNKPEDPDCMVGLALTDPRTSEEKEMKNWHVVEGNLFDHTAWTKIKELPVGEFDLIVCRPNGVFARVCDREYLNPHAYLAVVYRILQRAYKLMSRDDSEMFFELPRVKIKKSEYREIVAFMIKELWNAGISVVTDFEHDYNHPVKTSEYSIRSSLKIFKNENSPDEIPDICGGA